MGEAQEKCLKMENSRAWKSQAPHGDTGTSVQRGQSTKLVAFGDPMGDFPAVPRFLSGFCALMSSFRRNRNRPGFL